MANKLQLISELSAQTADQITGSVDGWKSYLDTAARLYKYSFNDQLLIYAQRPDATACAEMELWNDKMRRWVKPGSKGIALIRENAWGRPRLSYVFDVADTKPVRGARMPYLWEMREEHHGAILAALESQYGHTEGEDFGDRLMELAARAVGESYREYLHDLTYDLEDSFLEGMDELNVDVRFRNTLTASVQYTLLTRCGLDPALYLEDDDLRGITEFSTPAVLHHLGDAASTVSQTMLVEIGRTIRAYDREHVQSQNLHKPLAITPDIGYTKDAEEFNALKRESKENEGGQQHGRIDIQEERGLSGSQSGSGRGGRDGGNADGQIRDAAPDVPQGTPPRDIHLDAADGQAGTPSEGDRPAGAGTGGQRTERADGTERRGRSAESQQSDGVGAGGEQPESDGGRSRAERTGLRLNRNEYDTPPEPGSEKLPDFVSVEPETLLSGILDSNRLKEGRAAISAYFEAHPDAADRAAYVKSLHEPVYTEFDVGVVRVGFRAYEEGLYLWKGDTFISRTSASLLSWDTVQEYMAGMMERGEYLQPEDAPVKVPERKEKEVYQFSLFPTVEEQIENIAQAQAEEARPDGRSVSPVFSSAPEIPQDVVDRILTSGGNERQSIERIVAFYEKDKTGSAHVSFLKEEYRTGGKGFRLDGKEYALWFNEDGLRIAPGRTTNVPGCTLIPWIQVSTRIYQLLQEGRFATQEKLDAAQGNEYKEVAEKLWNLRRDFSEEAETLGFDLGITKLYGFPEVSAEIAKRLEDVGNRNELIEKLSIFAQAHGENPALMRFRFYKPKEVLERLKDLNGRHIEFPAAAPDFQPARPSFITQDEIDRLLAGGSGVSEGKMRIYSYFMQGHNAKERADFLKHEYGDGGSGRTGYNEDHNAKGIKLTRSDEISGYAGYDTVQLNWNRVEKRIHELINAGRYMNQQELDYLPEYEALTIAQEVNNFYYYAPNHEQKGYAWDWDADAPRRNYLPKLKDPEQTAELLADMERVIASVPADTRNFAYMQSAVNDLRSYQNGTYSLFSPLSAERLQEERQEKEAAKKKRAPEQDTPPADDLAAAARALSRKKPAGTKETSDGQLTFDFNARITEPEPLVAEEAAAPVSSDSKTEQREPQGRGEEESILSRYELGYGYFGNGLTVWNRLELEHGDYKTIAHIAQDRTVTFYDKDLPELIQAQIERVAAVTELSISATQDAPVFSTPAQQEPELARQEPEPAQPAPEVTAAESPVTLYRETLDTLTAVVRQSGFYSYLRDRDTDYDSAKDELDTEIGYYMEEIAESQPALHEAYTTLPLFREWLVEDILERTYQDIQTDSRDCIAQHIGDSDAPDWVKETGAGLSEPENGAMEDNRPQEKNGQPEPTGTGAPKAQESAAAQPKAQELNLTPNVDAYLNLKAEHPDKLIGVRVDRHYLFYGKDAEAAAAALGTNLVTREIPGLGETAVTGSPHAWQALLKKLLEKGQSVLFAEPDGLDYGIIKEGSAAEYIPLGMELTIDGRRMAVDSVDFHAGTVSLRDLDMQGWFPIFRQESVAFVRGYVEEAQDKALEDAARLSEMEPAESEAEPHYAVTETSDAFEDPYAVWDNQTGEYYRTPDGDIPTFEDEQEAAAYCADLEAADQLDTAKGLIADFLAQEYGEDEEPDFSDLENVGIAYTTTEDEQHEIQVSANLVEFSVSQYVDGVSVEKRAYGSLRELIDAELSVLDFDELTRLATEPEPAQEKQPPVDWVEIEGGEVARTTIDLTPEPDAPKAERHNYHITDDSLGAGGAKTKYAMNVAAIRTLKQVEAENRLATPEEQETLAKYVGWGGVADAFDPTRENWAKEYTELKELLTPEEYRSAQGSVLNAHYTSPTVIKAMYQAVENMGLRPGNVLEPAMGVGNFFGLVPESMEQARLYGVELDSLTGRIARQLYQKADITIAGFETTSRRDFYDLTVGNVPFGEYHVADRAYDKLGFSIHDYFLAKSLDQLRPGGIMAVVTSRYTMDKKGTEVRKHLAQKADLLGAVRLPNNAFRANAGTDVVSDILFFQKRDRAPEREPDWVQTGQNTDGLTMNQYFLQHPDMVLGEVTTKSTQYGHEELTVAPIPDADLSAQLAEAIPHLEAPNRELLEAKTAQEEELPGRESLPADPSVRNFSYTLVDGTIYFRENSRMNPVELGKTPAERVRGMVKIRDSARRLIDLQLEGAPDSEVTREQARLNTLYDQFSKKYGLLNSLGNKQAFEQDSAYPLLCSLEVLDDDGTLERKADMFTKRTIQRPHSITSVDTSVEALAVSIGEKACVDLGYMASLMGGSEKIPQIVADLKGIIFKDPASGPFDLESEDGTHWAQGWQAADEYLSGNVREKLVIARAAAETYPEFAVNVEKLEAVQPKELGAAEINVRIGASWIDPEYYKQFLFELLHTPQRLRSGKVDVRYAPITGDWNVKGKSEDSRDNVRANTTFGTKRINAYQIFENSLNQRDVRIFDTVHDSEGEHRVFNAKETAIAQQKQEAIGEEFKSWIFKDPERREALTKKYNELFNATRPREYDGSHIRFSGMNPEIALRPHQENAVAHIMYGHNTLLAHCVGAGKTYEMIAAAMESKRLGLCQKSLFVVPNHLTEQWGGDFLRLYPGANVLVATKKDFEPARRKKFCARIATGDYDAVVIGHTQFEKIPLSPQRQEAIIRDQIAEVVDAIQDAKDNDGERYTIKQMEKTKKNLEAKLKKLSADGKKDSVVTFEELGVDRLFVDEAHGFKNLFLHTKMRNVAGISQTEAQKSTDMFGKCRYMDELTGGRGITFATGTPVSNSMVELYTMMRYLQYDTLQKNGHGHFDNWAADFGEKVTAIELSPEGTGFRSKTRFARFFNLPELMSIWKESADIQTADMLKLPVPEAEYITVTTEPSEHQQAMVAELADRADAVRKGDVEPNIDNMLKITSDGRKLALDQRLQNPLLPDDPDSKVNACVKNIFDTWEESTPVKGTQLVFCDLSTPHYDGTFNVYDDIKNKLMERGIPPEEIAFIHDANTETQKAELFSKVRKGQVRVLIGSTQKMGAGTNVQDRIVASHDLDCPWRPADLEQRAGRTLRQGNNNKKVKMFKYVTKGTFDAYNWGLVENKQKFIGQIMTSKSPARSAEDIDATALSYAEVKALATGDERIKEKMDLDIQVAKLKLLKSNHTAQQYEMQDKAVKYYPQKIGQASLLIEGMKADLPIVQAHPIGEDSFSMTVMGTVFTERKEAGEAIIAACKTMTDPDQELLLGEYRGFPMKLSLHGTTFKVSMKQNLSYSADLSNDPSGNITRINNALEKIPDSIKGQESQLATLQTELENAREEAERPFPKEDELKTKSARLSQLNIELDMDQGGADEPAREAADAQAQAVGKPSILKALKQFDAPPPVCADRERNQEREVI